MKRSTTLLMSALISSLQLEAFSLYSDPSNGALYTQDAPGRTLLGDVIPSQTPSADLLRNVSIKGYLQLRHATTLDEAQPATLYSDKTVGEHQNFFIRRARLIIAASPSPYLSIYLQPDFASSSGSTNHLGQLRDFYGDIHLVEDKTHRLRVGQSKVPFGFENMQSSSKRLTPDRNDAFNSAVKNERDLGITYYYTPVHVQSLFKEIDAKGLKSTGNYGMFGIGVYNGQGANESEANDELHAVARLTYPFKDASGQIYEFGIQCYSGRYVSKTATYTDATGASAKPTLSDASGVDDARLGLSAMYYPQPFGLQAEYNWGVTPGLDDASHTIKRKTVHGGYLQAMLRLESALVEGDVLIPFVKWQYFDGYNKAETNAPRNEVNDVEAGFEWQIVKAVEFTALYHSMYRNDLATRGVADAPDYQRSRTSLLRLQLQINY